jgi:homoserine dehydrogenase
VRGGRVLPPAPAAKLALTPPAALRSRHYLRLDVKDQPGVLAKIASCTAKAGVSIASLMQRPSDKPEAASLLLTTHVSNEAQIRLTIARLTRLKCVLGKPLLLRIADF